MQKQRAVQTYAEKQQTKQLDKERKALMRSSMTEEEKAKQREKDRLQKKKKFASLTEEEKSERRKKDRLRKATKKEPAPKNWRELPRKWTKPSKPYYPDEQERNRLYQERRRQGRTEAEVEFEQIQNLLIKRNTRADRPNEKKEEENAKAKEGMQFLPFQPLKSRRKSKGHREEYMWWKYWKKGDEEKELIRIKLPEFGELFSMWDSKSQNPYEADEEKEEKWNALSHQEKLCEKKKLRRKWVNEQLKQPIEMPKMEQSEYEKIREQIIAEKDEEFQKYMMKLNVHE